MEKLPDPTTIVDSVADGIMEAAEGPVRIAANVAKVAQDFATEVKTNMENVKAKMPGDPSVLPDAAIKGAGQTVKAGIGMFDAFGRGVMETFEGVKKQIQRVTG